MPIAGGGSVSTGLTVKCPVCGKMVKVVGNGKLSTHNQSKGVRCGGSGQATTNTGLVRPTATRTPPRKTTPPRAATTTGRRRRDDRRPPPSPVVPYGNPTSPVGQFPAVKHRMAGWVAGSQSPAPAKHQAELHAYQQHVVSWQRNLDRNTIGIRSTMLRGYGPGQNRRWDSSVGDYRVVDPPSEEELQDIVDNDIGVRSARTGLENAQRKLDVLEAEKDTVEPFDPTDPLAYYGDMLHIEDQTWHTYETLDQLEQRVPPQFHRAVAEYLADRQRYTPEAGIYIGTSPVVDLDTLYRTLTGHPRGWRADATWADIDGVVSAGAVVAIGYTNNTESHRRSRASTIAATGDFNTRLGGNAGLHEFGHILDRAMGYRDGDEYTQDKRASQQRRFRLLHSKIKQEAGIWLAPYFRQRGNAGPEEFWADSFFSWSAVAPDRQEPFLVQQYGMRPATARDLIKYFDTLQKELETGRRLPILEVVR
jgi:hypothetical protein